MNRERAKNATPVVVVDGGQSLGVPTSHEAELPQRRIKARLIGEALSVGGIDAMALGDRDWALGTESVRRIVDELDLPVVAANLTCSGTAPYPAFRVVEAGEKRLGIVGVTLGEVEGCEVSDPVAAVRAALSQLTDVDVTVALVPETTPAFLEWGDHGLAVDLIVHARGGRVGHIPETRGGIHFLQTGSEGKVLGLAELRFDSEGEGVAVAGHRDLLNEEIARYEERIGQVKERLPSIDEERYRQRMEQQLRYYETELASAQQEVASLGVASARRHRLALRTVDLDRSLPDHEATKTLVEAAKQAINDLGSPADPHRRFLAQRRLAPADSPYAGGEACIGCHRAEHVQWASTPHSRAYNTLLSENRAVDADCWSCHVTGAGQAGGPQTPVEAVGLHDVQCEACHGPSRAHTQAPTAVKPARTVPEAVCAGCHDGKQDEGRFDYGTYLPKVVHGG